MNIAYLNSRLFLVILLWVSQPVFPDAKNQWYVKPYVGLSQLSDTNAESMGIGSVNAQADIDTDSGFVSGIGLGYRVTENIATEFGWEYRSNDSEVVLADGQVYSDGNYASNLFYLNGVYFFAPSTRWDPYIGAGITWLQEVDLDLERPGEELSYSDNGDLGYQLFAGTRYKVNSQWSINSELRYGYIDNIRLKGEQPSGRFDGLDYEPLTIQVGFSYHF